MYLYYQIEEINLRRGEEPDESFLKKFKEEYYKNLKNIIFYYKNYWEYISESDLFLMDLLKNRYGGLYEKEINNNYLLIEKEDTDVIDNIIFTNTKNVKNIKVRISLWQESTLEYNFSNNEKNNFIKINLPIFVFSGCNAKFIFETFDYTSSTIKCKANKIHLPSDLRLHLFCAHLIRYPNIKLNKNIPLEKKDLFYKKIYKTMKLKEKVLKEIIWHPKTTFQKEESMKYYQEYLKLAVNLR